MSNKDGASPAPGPATIFFALMPGKSRALPVVDLSVTYLKYAPALLLGKTRHFRVHLRKNCDRGVQKSHDFFTAACNVKVPFGAVLKYKSACRDYIQHSYQVRAIDAANNTNPTKRQSNRPLPVNNVAMSVPSSDTQGKRLVNGLTPMPTMSMRVRH